jgi:hypothetical protein
MARKKWTPHPSADQNILHIREKRKWQIALRRYVLEEQKCSAYAPYFGATHALFREWIALQFHTDLNWENFSEAWQFDHVVPVAFFDFHNESDLRLCWHFVNIRVDRLQKEGVRTHRTDLTAARQHFEKLFAETGFSICEAMVNKIGSIIQAGVEENDKLLRFLKANRQHLEAAAGFSGEDLERINGGMSITSLLAEKEFLKKYGS